jgi:NADP-dependent 3-hydroxy acid dehydrogenase YdfG
MSQLSDKVALVTGGGSGIGLSVARLFLQDGARVVITGRDGAKLERAAGELKGGERLMQLPCDATDPKQVATLVQRVREKFGRIDILVNNAGMNIKHRTFRELTPESWDKMVRANLDSAFYCTHAVLPEMIQRKDGLIINISSVAGKRANPLGGPAYVAAKFGMTGLGICLAAEEKDSNIRVSNVYPGEVDTPILEHRPTPVTEEHRQRILQPEDIAQGVLFIAKLPPRVSVPELVIKPTSQVYI